MRLQAMAQTTVTDIPTIGDVIRAWRIFRELSSGELAVKAGVRPQYLSEIEHNRTANPWQKYLKKLAVALNVSLRDIYGRRMPDGVNDGKVAGEEDMQGVALREVAEGEAPGGVQPAIEKPTQKTSSSRTLYDSPLSPSPQIILMRRLAVLEKKLASAEKNLHDAKEELRGLRALAADMQNSE